MKKDQKKGEDQIAYEGMVAALTKALRKSGMVPISQANRVSEKGGKRFVCMLKVFEHHPAWQPRMTEDGIAAAMGNGRTRCAAFAAASRSIAARARAEADYRMRIAQCVEDGGFHLHEGEL